MPGPLNGIVTEAQRQQYRDEGYFVMERALPADDLGVLRDECAALVRAQDEEMDRLFGQQGGGIPLAPGFGVRGPPSRALYELLDTAG